MSLEIKCFANNLKHEHRHEITLPGVETSLIAMTEILQNDSWIVMSDIASDAIESLRALLSKEVNASLFDSDCLRFLNARKGDIGAAVKFVNEWYHWHHSPLKGKPDMNFICLQC